ESPEADFTVTNPNGRAIALDAAYIPLDSGFRRVGGTCAERLRAYSSCTVSVAFAPRRTGPVSTALTVTSGADTARASLTGAGFVHLTVAFSGADDRTVTVVDGENKQLCKRAPKRKPVVPKPDVPKPVVPKTCEKIPVPARELELPAPLTDPDASFSGWSGDCDAAAGAVCAPRLDRDVEVTAAFE
uniref:hypothetical protein n=1 Tax=Streptomyces flavofungini TaxID=68200 RepID=UPI0034DDF483